MSTARIVTDSAAELSPEVIEKLGITVVPWRIHLGSETLLDLPGLRTLSFYKEMARKKVFPSALPPTSREFSEAYAQLAKDTDNVVSIHTSSGLARVVQAANRGRAGFVGRCQVNLVDSQFISRALGILVIAAAKAAWEGASGPEIVRFVHGMIPRTYFAFHVDTVEYLSRNRLLPDSYRAAARRSRPLLLLEDGEIVALQRSRSRGTPIERLVEFAAEFKSIGQIIILHTGLGPSVEEVKAQLAEVLPMQPEEHVYSPVLAAQIGPAALGLVVFEE